MLRDKIKIKKTVYLSLSAEDWELYTSMPASPAIAAALNIALENCHNTGMSRRDTHVHMYRMMRAAEFAKHGAADSEPFRVLARVLDNIFMDTDK